jgi:hypothetical protein
VLLLKLAQLTQKYCVRISRWFDILEYNKKINSMNIKNELLTSKINEAIELAMEVNEPNAQIVLLALQGARKSFTDDHLALNVQEFIKLVLHPMVANKNLS